MSESNEQIFPIKASLDFIYDVEQIASFKLPKCDDVAFSRIWMKFKGLSNDESLSNSDRKNYSKIEGHISELRECMIALFYHINNVKKLENSLNIIIKKYQNSTPCASGGCYNPSLTNRFTFEYHAFAFASVRCVNHVFPILGYICFRKKCPNRKSIQKNIGEKKSSILDSINRTLQKHSVLEKLFKSKNQKSIRDLIAHERFLYSGSLHIEKEQAKLIGILPLGISRFDDQLEPNIYYLSQIMTTQAEQIKQFIMEMLETIIRFQ